MAERLSEEDFAGRLASELERTDKLVGLVCRSKETQGAREVFRIWGEEPGRRVTVSRFSGKKQTSQETFLASELPARARELSRAPFAFWELQTTESDLHARRAKRAILVSRGKASSEHAPAKKHDRPRERVFDLASPEDRKLLAAIGLASEKGHVLPGRERKLRQVEHFVRLVLEALGEAKGDLEILDAGCGAAYLTFALHHVLARSGRRVRVTGVDVREDVVRASEEIAKKLGVAEDVRFQRARIEDAKLEAAPGLVLSLHACDTATDEALAKGVLLGASVILAAPCCQHELHEKLTAAPLAPLLRHGILRERLADLATDALRASILRAVGYKTDVIEFVDPDATAKNLLIRAVHVRAPRDGRWMDEVAKTKAALGLTEPVALERLLVARLGEE